MAVFDIFVQNPALIALVSGIFFGVYLFLRSKPTVRSRPLLMPATAWLLWALWEWAIVLFTPEANIRVDLLLIIPLVLAASIYGIVWPLVKRSTSAVSE